MLPPIAQDVVALMKKLKAANNPVKASALRSKIESLLESMTAKAANAALAEGQHLGVWP